MNPKWAWGLIAAWLGGCAAETPPRTAAWDDGYYRSCMAARPMVLDHDVGAHRIYPWPEGEESLAWGTYPPGHGLSGYAPTYRGNLALAEDCYTSPNPGPRHYSQRQPTRESPPPSKSNPSAVKPPAAPLPVKPAQIVTTRPAPTEPPPKNRESAAPPSARRPPKAPG